MPFLVPAPSALSKCSGRGPSLLPPADVSIIALGAAIHPLRGAPSPPLGLCLLVTRAVGVFSSPPPVSVYPPRVGTVTLWGLPGFRPSWAPLPLWGCRHPEATRIPAHTVPPPPPGGFLDTPEASHMRPLPTPWDSGSTLEASLPPLFPPTLEGSSPSNSRWPPSCHPCPCLAPWRPRVPASSAVAEAAFRSSLPPARTSTRSPPGPLSFVPHGNAVSVSSLLSGFPTGIPSSFVSASDMLSLLMLHSSLSACL